MCLHELRRSVIGYDVPYFISFDAVLYNTREAKLDKGALRVVSKICTICARVARFKAVVSRSGTSKKCPISRKREGRSFAQWKGRMYDPIGGKCEQKR